MISVSHISMVYGARLLFDDVNLNLLKGYRYALVGANGTGKSTFLKLLAGHDAPSLGEVIISKKASIGFLKQDQFRYEHDTVLEVVLQGKPRLWEALREKEKLLAQDLLDEKMGLRLALLEDIIFQEDGYTAETFAQTLLLGLGIEAGEHRKALSALSGGFKLRVLLAQSLFEQPDILLLDEPTNHLDIMSIAWLEEYLKNEFKGVLIFISHDQGFLNALATHVLDVDYGEIREYVGNYDHFIQEKQLRVEQKLREHQYIENKIAHMRVFVDRFKASASRSKQAMSREKMIDKLELPDIKKSSRVSPKFLFKQKRPSGKKILEVEKLGKQFGPKTVLKNVHFSVDRGEKVAIIGHNGIGKSTLLKILLEKHQADQGNYTWGYESHIAYFAQDHHEALDQKVSVLEWLSEVCSQETREGIRQALGQMLLGQDDIHKKVSTLSGGEAARLLFASMVLQKANILILDEPTNHLDLESREALALALREFEGTVLFVSHDRSFVSSIANRVLALTEKGVTDFQGSYQDYLNEFGEDYLNKVWLLEQEKQ
ncbi:MAG: ABC-F family ATP-binding cassette domain-containing protein [Gammaproteobacteria bacterium]|nr:ABC-F family ATP-binding cassette domain-containing protein [Gammaproteobacteria bacterium]MBP9729092.1 ABC-F family ATP-binding cassette domain-containing protein [Gammaproteobacteria bacterium]